MNYPNSASGPHFRICPLCEASSLIFSGWNLARCPECNYEPSENVLETLRQIVALPDVSQTLRNRTE